eukprot:TRINITY_DN64691_c0_g2_i1.p1 TRINITY_DN64691_c0_g2~~TRINITY_DN64691_c0_g2_i1.p1  ORF type:complete len:539 (-),score=42.77 TRINITY_DN64691_c0_g2_i1:87-1595(-)
MKGSGVYGSQVCPGPNPPSSECPATPVYYSGRFHFPDLWPCPTAWKNDSIYWNAGGSKSLANTCFHPTNGSFNCKDQTPFKKWKEGLGCCCPTEGCWTEPRFNWILSACQGFNCGFYSKVPEIQKFKQNGTDVVVNYVAAYQWEVETATWVMQRESSFNTDGKFPPYDLLKPNGGLSPEEAWMAPQPGGSAWWGWGYYPGGAAGVGAPGMMFVLSTERIYNTAWYMINQVNLDRGPDKMYPASHCPDGINKGCWDGGNAGEIDFLEATWTSPNGTIDDYRRLYATQWNDDGRANPGCIGSTCVADGGWYINKGLNKTTNSYFLGSDPKNSSAQPMVWVAVVDRVGTYIYRIPGDSAESYWPGLGRKKASCRVRHRPLVRPPNDGPPCRDDNPYCALFLPNCQAHTWGSENSDDGLNQGCRAKAWTGMCSNWWTLMDNTNQWQWPEGAESSVINFGKIIGGNAPEHVMPWSYKMEATQVDWFDKPAPDKGSKCCVENGPCRNY